jgi:peptide/nickel transport system substrate-binding protein
MHLELNLGEIDMQHIQAMSRRHVGITIAVLALACSINFALTEPVRAQTQKILTTGGPFSPLSLDPSLSGNGRAGMAVMPAYEPLVRTNPDGSFSGGLATKWEMTPDNLSVTFTLRKDAKFSDGDPVDAEAAKKSLDYFRNKKGGPFAVNFAKVTSIDVLDSQTFKVTMSSPQPNLVSLFDALWLAGGLISPKGVDNPDTLLKETRGAGPYKLDPATTITGKSYTFVPNEHYYDKSKQKWDKVTYSVFEDMNSAIQAVKAGQIKLLASDALTANANAANLPKDVRIVSDPVAWVGMIFLDRTGEVQPELKDVRVRQAINHALDRKLMTQALFGKFADPTSQIQGKGFMGSDDANEARYPYDPAKAKELLTAAGYPNGFELKLGYVNNTMSQNVQQVVVSQLKKVGITTKQIEFQNFGAMNQAFANKAPAALIFNTNSGVPNLAKFQTLDVNGSLNPYKSVDAKLNQLVEEASNTPIDKADKAWKMVYAHVNEIAWFAPVSAIHAAYFVTDAIKTPSLGQTVIVDMNLVEPAN